ncbi:hypothetical protein RKD23_003531 [Streptomyces sp. SAI-170]|uniref:hypothetical protein n=1 Tax=Streptomyces sp. SAI-170 TaxID=3377729 RepID=UPI003C7D80F9
MTPQLPVPPPLRRLAAAELRRLSAPAGVRYACYALPAALVLYAAVAYLTHDTDTAGAWQAAESAHRRYLAAATARGIPTAQVPPPATFFDDPRYLFTKAVFVDLRAVLSGLAVAALVLGIRAGGADWSSRVLLTLAAAEPRRPRLFAVRGALVTACGALAALLAAVALVPLLAGAGYGRGSLDGIDGTFWRVLALITLRGALLVGLIGLLGYCLGMLTRGTALALGITLAYLVAAERLLQDYVPSLTEFHLSGITFAVLNERLLMNVDRTQCLGQAACDAMQQGTTGTQAFTALAVHLLPLAAAAYWRFTRRDLG